MLFHMVASVLLSMVAFSTILWLVKIIQQPIGIFAMAVDGAAMENKTMATMWKSIKTDSDTDVQNDFTFCLEPPIEKTNIESGLA